MNVLMALTDFIPVILYTISVVILQRYLYGRMSKGPFALFAGGTVMVYVAGFFKATWKLLYNAGICDFRRLNDAFFPMQSVGFLLAGLAMLARLFVKQEQESLNANAMLPLILTAPAVFSGTMIFVAGNLLGTIAINASLCVDAKKQHKPFAIAMFVLSSISLILMGYLSSRDFAEAYMNWIAQGVNTCGMICLLLGSIKLSKNA